MPIGIEAMSLPDPLAERIVRRFLAAKAPVLAVGQVLKLIDERANFKRPLEAPVSPIHNGELMGHMPPNEIRRSVWEQLLSNGYLQTEPVNERRVKISLSEAGKAALDSWLAKAKGKLVYVRDRPETWIVELDGQQIGQWERSGDPSVRGYRRVGYEEPEWSFTVDAYDDTLEEKLKKLPETPRGFEGLTLPPAAKKWLVDQLKLLGILA